MICTPTSRNASMKERRKGDNGERTLCFVLFLFVVALVLYLAAVLSLHAASTPEKDLTKQSTPVKGPYVKFPEIPRVKWARLFICSASQFEVFDVLEAKTKKKWMVKVRVTYHPSPNSKSADPVRPPWGRYLTERFNSRMDALIVCDRWMEKYLPEKGR